MKKVIGFIKEQLILIISFLCFAGLIYMCYSYFDNTSNPIVVYNEENIGNYQLIIGLNTGESEIDDILKIELKKLNTNEICFIADSAFEISLVFSIALLVILDFFSLITTMIHYVIITFKDNKYKKILQENNEISEEYLQELPTYEPIIANVIYQKSYAYEMTVNRLKYYYRSKGILNKFDKLKKDVNFDMNSLTEIEKFAFNSSISEMTEIVYLLFRAHQRKVNDERRMFKNLIKEKLIEKGFYEEDEVKQKVKEVTNILRNFNGGNVSQNDLKKIIKYILICLAFGIVAHFSKIASWTLIILVTWILMKYFGITLTQKGKIERAKLHFLIKHLKTKENLSEEENYFLIMLTKV